MCATVIPPLAASLSPPTSQQDVMCSGGGRLIHCMSEIQAAKIFSLRCLFRLLLFSLTYSRYSRHLTSLADENKQKIIKAMQRPVQSSLQAKVWAIQLLLLILYFPLMEHQKQQQHVLYLPNAIKATEIRKSHSLPSYTPQ